MTKRQTTYSHEDLIACGEGRLFDGSRLPKPPMLMFDRFTKITEDGGLYGKGEMIAEQDLNKDLWFFSCHFQDDPVLPGSLGLDALWQMLGFYLAWKGHRGKGRAIGCGKISLTDQILPEITLVQYKLDIKRIIKRQLVLGIADGFVIVNNKVVYTCKDLKAGLF